MASEEEQEKKYEVKDKRRFNPDGTPKEQAEEQSAEPQAEEPQAEPAGAGEAASTAEQPSSGAAEQDEAGGMPPPNVYAMLEFVVGLLSEQAWQLMGVRLAPGQKEMVKDMAQAKLAIDTVVFIADKLQPHVEEEDRRALRALISDLQMNFVVQNK